MKCCKNCSKEIHSSKKFCNQSCSAIYNNKNRVVSEKTKSKIKESLKKSFDSLSDDEKIKRKEKQKKINSNPERITKVKNTWIQKFNDLPFEELSWDMKRDRIKEEQNFCCGRCGIDNWLNELITLEIDHIDGDNTNNERENLIGLCPNCHSLTPTWRGKNKGTKVTDEQFIEALKNTNNIRSALLKLGLSDRGGNYKRAKILLEKIKNP